MLGLSEVRGTEVLAALEGAEMEVSAGGQGSAGAGTKCFKMHLKTGVIVITGCYILLLNKAAGGEKQPIIAPKPHLTDEMIRIINNEASICKQHVIIAAAGDGASLKFFTVLGTETSDKSESTCDDKWVNIPIWFQFLDFFTYFCLLLRYWIT